jgi:BMFP domain-containing protein YqiC
MQKNHKFFEDIARMASSAGGTFMEMKREMEAAAASQVEKILRRMDLVTREDFNLVREMAVKARAEQDKLEARIAALEKQLGKPSASAPAKAGTKAATGPKKATAKSSPKPATKKPAAKKPASKPATAKK